MLVNQKRLKDSGYCNIFGPKTTICKKIRASLAQYPETTLQGEAVMPKMTLQPLHLS